MARKINYIDPIDSVQGLIGAKQDLRYNDNNNKGYYAPAGKVNAAKNYQTRMIGMVRSRTGAKYYAVRKKSSFNANENTLHACALMAGARLIAGKWMHDLTYLPLLQAYARKYNIYAQYNTFYQWLFHEAYWRLQVHEKRFGLQDGDTIIELGTNPWADNQTTQDVLTMDWYNLTKFWGQLTKDGYTIFINGMPQPWLTRMSWWDMAEDEYINRSNINVESIGDSEYAKQGSYYLVDEAGRYVIGGSIPAANSRYFLTYQRPQS